MAFFVYITFFDVADLSSLFKGKSASAEPSSTMQFTVPAEKK